MPLITAPLRDVATATPRTRLLSVALDARAFDFQPGQAVMVGAHGQAQRRPYSIACSPERAADDLVELTLANGAPDNVTVVAVWASEPTLLSLPG